MSAVYFTEVYRGKSARLAGLAIRSWVLLLKGWLYREFNLTVYLV